jgi:hypothetical protein
VIAHLVLFRPKPTLSEDQRAAFVRALDTALNDIPLIKRAHVGRRLVMGRQYDESNVVEFPFCAVLEFENRADLLAYLEHPAHQELGTQFYVTSDAALAYDFEMLGPSRTGELL